MMQTKGYQEFTNRIRFIDFFVDSGHAILADARLHKFNNIAPSALAETKKAIKSAQELKREFGWDRLFSDSLILWLSLAMDSFDVYLKAFLGEFYRKNSSILNNVYLKNIDLHSALSSKDIEEIKGTLFVSFLNSLSWERFDTLIDSLKGFGKTHPYLNVSNKEWTDLKKGKLIRNLSVHSNCIVDADFKRKFGKPTLKLGDRFELDIADFLTYYGTIKTVANKLNNASPSVRDKKTKEAFARALQSLASGDFLIS
ncbi:MAG: hypothetical protein HYX41_06975 [Bdellovibrio sp.]|nr:hypothetical protein [Bdellovibrio sp.]